MRNPESMKKWLGAVLLAAGIISTAAEKPGVIWCSAPVKPGEIVMVFGGEWGKSPKVDLGGGKTIEPLQVTDTTVNFFYPKDLPMGILKGKIVADGQSSREFALNQPDIWWLQGDWGKEASPGGWLRAFGRCLSFDNKAAMTIKSNGKSIDLKLEKQDCWSLNAALPSDLAAGEYELILRNGLGSDSYPLGKMTVKPHAEVWKTKVFNATEYGAVANDGFDDTVAVKSALEAIKANGGGILYFPRGRYQINGMLEIPPCALLKGESMELSQLYWPDTDNPPEALIKGTHSFGIEDIFLTSGFHQNGIMSEGDNITLRRIRTRLNYSQYLTREEATRREAILGNSRILVFHGDFVRVIGCDIYTVAGGSFGISGNYYQVTDNIFGKGSPVGWSGFHGSQMIVDNNKFTGSQGVSFGATSAEGTRNIYWGNNYQQCNFAWDCEAFTCDGGVPCYKDTAESVKGTELQLKKFAWRHGADFWQKGYVQLVAGKGAGQIRKIAKIDGNKVTVDQPWDILPDEKTFIVIAAFRQHFIYVNNETNDSTVAMQLYGSMISAIIANNKASRSGGYHNYGMTKGGSPEVNWFVQYFDNKILEGNAYRGPMNEIPTLDSHIAIRDRGVPKELGSFPITRACLMRRNILESNARLEVLGDADCSMIENCIVKNSDVGINVENRSKNVILWGNRFENVKKPYQTGSGTLINPASAVSGSISGAMALLGKSTPPEWTKLLAELDTLAGKNLSAAETGAAANAILELAVKSLAKQQGDKPVRYEAFSSLLGITIEAPNWRSTDKIFSDGEAGSAQLLITAASSYLPGKLEIKPGTVPGWTVSIGDLIIEAGKGGRSFASFTKPAGKPGSFTLPLHCIMIGKDWKLVFDTDLKSYDANSRIPITDFLVAGPFANKSGKNIDSTVHPPELKLDVTGEFETRDGKRGWVQAKADKSGSIDLSKVFKTSPQSVAYAVAVLRAAKPIQIRLRFSGPGMLCYLNGTEVGTVLGRGQWGCVTLNKGDNRLMMISTNDGSPDWKLNANFAILGDMNPGDLVVLPAEELTGALELKPAAGQTPATGKNILNSEGIDWKLVFEDNFNRRRLGNALEGRTGASWQSSGLKIQDNSLHVNSFSSIAYALTVKAPVRLELDVFTEQPSKVYWMGIMLNPKGLSSNRRYWGQMQGSGYFLSLGWHDRFSNGIMRNEKEVMVDDKGMQLKPNQKYHVIAQFIPPNCQVYVDGKEVLNYKDENWIGNLDEVALFSGVPEWSFDNLLIYTGDAVSKTQK